MDSFICVMMAVQPNIPSKQETGSRNGQPKKDLKIMLNSAEELIGSAKHLIAAGGIYIYQHWTEEPITSTQCMICCSKIIPKTMFDPSSVMAPHFLSRRIRA